MKVNRNILKDLSRKVKKALICIKFKSDKLKNILV